jgi:hypothetical protein
VLKSIEASGENLICGESDNAGLTSGQSLPPRNAEFVIFDGDDSSKNPRPSEALSESPVSAPIDPYG